ncbi:MAG: sensory histidine kinase AtoS [Verrucomicrobiales bacterium]|nr:sensory histidine kinase AtoS [Verrucomicrobiales bacterium]
MLKNDAEKRIIGLFAIILVLLAAITAAAVRNVGRSALSSDWVNHVHAVNSEAEGIVSAVNVGERGLRDFLLTGSERDRAVYRRGYNQAVEHLTLGKALTAQEPGPNKLFVQLEGLVATRVDFARGVVKARTEEGIEAARKLIMNDPGETTEIERNVERLKNEEQGLLRAWDKESYLQAQNTRWIFFIGAAINFGILVFIAYLIRSDFRARRQAIILLEESNRQLDARVAERTRDLAAANTKLENQNLEERWANQALDHQLRYSQLIINSVDSLVLVITRASNITRINPAVTRSTGLEPRELVGRSLQQILIVTGPQGEEDNSGVARISASMRDGRDLTDVRGLLYGRDKKAAKVDFSVFPVRDRDKIVGGVVTIKLDRPMGMARG